MQDLKSIVYVSTAFFHGLRSKDVVYEKVDDANDKLPEQLQTLCDNFDDEVLEKFGKILIEKDSNIYTTTKWAAEILIKKIGEGLPVAVVRPSMITPTLSDPMPGWIDNFYGPIGVNLGIFLGFIRVLLQQNIYNVDVIPADYVTNCMIASARDVSRQTNRDFLKNGTSKQSTVKFYNCVSSSQNPVTYGKSWGLLHHYYKSTPYSMQVFYDSAIVTSNIPMYYILKYILCIIPAYIMEFSSYCIFKPIKISAKLKKALYHYEITFPMTTCQWNLQDDNVRILWHNLDDKDKMLFNFDMTNIDWNLYSKTFVEGVRVYLLKDPMETVPRVLKRRLKLKKIYYSIVASLFGGFFLYLTYV